MEQYYSVADIAAKLNLSKPMIRKLFGEQPGVLRIGARGRRSKRDYLTLRIPGSAVDAFITESAVPESPTPLRRRQASADAHA